MIFFPSCIPLYAVVFQTFGNVFAPTFRRGFPHAFAHGCRRPDGPFRRQLSHGYAGPLGTIPYTPSRWRASYVAHRTACHPSMPVSQEGTCRGVRCRPVMYPAACPSQRLFGFLAAGRYVPAFPSGYFLRYVPFISKARRLGVPMPDNPAADNGQTSCLPCLMPP